MPNEIIKEQNMEHAARAIAKCFLEYGIQNTTKNLIISSSGLSRATINRYYSNKTSTVISAIDYAFKNSPIFLSLNDTDNIPHHIEGNTGYERLLKYFILLKDTFMQDPQLFVLYGEFKDYIYRAKDISPEEYSNLFKVVEYKTELKDIYRQGIADHTLYVAVDLESDVDYICSIYFGFLSNLAMRPNLRMDWAEEMIDRYIDRVMNRHRAFIVENKVTP